ncbi:hypothetical protein T08_5595 [Trichinella sp. T8]|nr:hypothetical protein T08_5595 [Trichinella sp. T8]
MPISPCKSLYSLKITVHPRHAYNARCNGSSAKNNCNESNQSKLFSLFYSMTILMRWMYHQMFFVQHFLSKP